MSNEPLNTAPLQQFIKQVQAAENSRAKEVRMDIAQAKNLAFALGIVMSRMHGDLEKFVKENASGASDDIIKVEIGSGGEWK
ncbi:hypothetical protein N9993_00770 [bacterium]|jgi:hypothetical protein|nr:hypothetical protein [bacterium]MDC3339557.1 hypothetical protein [Planktomarina temperata]